jgi:hypothetical protein
MPVQAMAQLDFSGGVNVVSSPYALGQKQVLRAINMILDEHGALKVRDGTRFVDRGPAIDAAIVALYDFVNAGGGRTPLAILQPHDGSPNQLYRREVSPWTLLGTFTTNFAIPQIIQLNDRAIIAAGYETPKSLAADGVTFGPLGGGLPGAQHLAVHLGAVWAWNTNPTTTATDGPSSLRQSNVNDPDTWNIANQAFISKDDGQVGMGLGVFTIAETGISPTQTLVAFKNFSTYQVTGLFGSSNFSIQKIKSDMGCVAPRTIQFVSGFGIIRLSHRGFALFNGVDDLLISEEIRPYLFGRDDISGLNWSRIHMSMAAQVHNPPLYLCACPTGTGALDRVFCYDLIRRAWTILQYPYPIGTLATILVPGALPSVLLGEWTGGGPGTGGAVRRIFNEADDDDGVAISWQVRPRPLMVRFPADRLYARRLQLTWGGVTAAQNVTVTMALSPGNRVARWTIPVSATGTGAAQGWSLGGWGQEPWGSTVPVVQVSDTMNAIDVHQLATLAVVELTGAGRLRLRGLEWQVRPKPLVATARVAT